MREIVKSLSMVAVLVGAATVASGAPACTVGAVLEATFTATAGVPGLLTVSQNPCDHVGYTFSNWNIHGVNIPGASIGSPLLITVNITGLLVNGLSFGYNNIAGLDFEFTYNISPGISSMILSTNSATGISEVICASSFAHGESCPAGQGATGPTASSISGPVTIGTRPTADAIFVFKDVGGGSQFTQVFVPEPASLSLVGFVLIGVGLAARRRRK